MAYAILRRLLLIGAFLTLGGAQSFAADGSDSAQPELRALIERQLDAFAHDDADAAYALAAPALKSVFTDSGVFLAMVRGNYAPVYRHRSAEFGETAVEGDSASQIVTIVDNDNVVWKALYKLARQPDGKWLINGCVLVKSTDDSI